MTSFDSARQIRNGDEVTVHYIGRLENGTIFDSSRSRGREFSFTLGKIIFNSGIYNVNEIPVQVLEAS